MSWHSWTWERIHPNAVPDTLRSLSYQTASNSNRPTIAMSDSQQSTNFLKQHNPLLKMRAYSLASARYISLIQMEGSSRSIWGVCWRPGRKSNFDIRALQHDSPPPSSGTLFETVNIFLRRFCASCFAVLVKPAVPNYTHFLLHFS